MDQKPLKADKGLKGGSCNVTACQKDNSALYYNKSTRKYYCMECANAINSANAHDCMRLYGTWMLCELDDEPMHYHNYDYDAVFCAPAYPEEQPQVTYSGPPRKGKKGRIRRW